MNRANLLEGLKYWEELAKTMKVQEQEYPLKDVLRASIKYIEEDICWEKQQNVH